MSPSPHRQVATFGRALVEIENGLAQMQDIDCDIIRFAGFSGQRSPPGLFPCRKTSTQVRPFSGKFSPFRRLRTRHSIIVRNPGRLPFISSGCANAPYTGAYYQYAAEKYGLEPPHFISSEQDPQRIIMAEKICHELEFVYQYPDPNFMLTTEE